MHMHTETCTDDACCCKDGYNYEMGKSECIKCEDPPPTPPQPPTPEPVSGCAEPGAHICHYDDLAWWVYAYSQAHTRMLPYADPYTSGDIYLGKARALLEQLLGAWASTAGGG